jgi:hypothetical protein
MPGSGQRSSSSRKSLNNRRNNRTNEEPREMPRPRTSLFPAHYERPVSRFNLRPDVGLHTPIDNFSKPVVADSSDKARPKAVSKRPFYMSSSSSGSFKEISSKFTKFIIFILTILSIAAILKGAQLAYYTFLDIDYTLCCPSPYAYANSGLSRVDQQQIKESFRNIKCVECPELRNGHCNLNGRIICDSGFKQSGKKCIEDGAYNQKIEEYANLMHQNYLYHLGDRE